MCFKHGLLIECLYRDTTRYMYPTVKTSLYPCRNNRTCLQVYEPRNLMSMRSAPTTITNVKITACPHVEWVRLFAQPQPNELQHQHQQRAIQTLLFCYPRQVLWLHLQVLVEVTIQCPRRHCRRRRVIAACRYMRQGGGRWLNEFSMKH